MIENLVKKLRAGIFAFGLIGILGCLEPTIYHGRSYDPKYVPMEKKETADSVSNRFNYFLSKYCGPNFYYDQEKLKCKSIDSRGYSYGYPTLFNISWEEIDKVNAECYPNKICNLHIKMWYGAIETIYSVEETDAPELANLITFFRDYYSNK